MGALRFSQHHQRSQPGQGTLIVYILCLQVGALIVTEMGDPHKMIETSRGHHYAESYPPLRCIIGAFADVPFVVEG